MDYKNEAFQCFRYRFSDGLFNADLTVPGGYVKRTGVPLPKGYRDGERVPRGHRGMERLPRGHRGTAPEQGTKRVPMDGYREGTDVGVPQRLQMV